jgi:hypothetical protein
VIIVYHQTQERGAVELVNKLRKQGANVMGYDLKYFNGEPDDKAVAVYSPKYNSELARLYGDRYMTKKPGRRKKDEVRNN